MANEARPAAGAWRTYLELASGVGDASRKQVRKVLKDLVGKGNTTAEQLRTMTTELVAANLANREALGKLVRMEVDRALGRVGLATMDEVNQLTTRVRELERQLREARTAQTPPTTGRTVAPTPAAARTAAAPPTTAGAARRGGRPTKKAAETPAASPAVKKATRTAATAKATPAKATATKAVRAKATPAKATKARRAQQ